MSQTNADRNLLFGILALQMDFITRDALIAAMNAWVVDKAKPLGQILEENGSLSASRRAMLEPLVDEHVRAHGGDPARSLATLSSIGPARDVIQRVDDADVRASLAHVGADAFATHHDPDGGTVYRPDDPLDAPDSVRFRRLRPHAKGNLGEVFVARDRELNREVALKEIQEKHADRHDSRQRFLVEAEITGGLEHPGIVPVYGLGRYPDGRPFYAMRFIKGDSLAEAIAAYHNVDATKTDPGERSLALRKLLRRFQDVCNAVAYAHSRGVLHRDLKPGNIMVGRYGETVVVDWGLARTSGDASPEARSDSDEPALSPISGSGLPETLAGTAIGTPAYMPPEQAAGRLDLLSPRSDVYSLGATLYHVLTGHAPFGRGELAEILRRVMRGEFPAPRSVAPAVPKGLEAICLKAMATQSADRYASALALAADLDHWLADEPTDALPDRPFDRLARWSRHHRAATLATAGTLISLTLAATTAAALITRAHRETQKALDDRTAALTAQTRATEDKAASLASETRAKDQMRAVFNRARHTVSDLIEIVRDDRGLREDPALRPARLTLLRRALAFSQGFVKDFEGVPDLRVEVADAYHQVAKITTDIGRPIDAEPAYRKTVATYEALIAERPEVDDYRDGLGRACNNLGNLEANTGRPGEAERSYARAIEEYDRIAARRPENADFRTGLAKACNNLGLLQAVTGRPAEAHRSYLRAREQYERLVAERPRVDDHREELARTCTNLGNLQSDTGRPAEAERNYVLARELRERLVAERPRVDDYREELAKTIDSLGNLQGRSGRPGEAERSYLRARELRERLVAERPESDAYRDGLSKTCNNLGNLLSHTGRPGEAERSYLRAREIQERLVAERPESDEYRDGLGKTCINLGVLEANTVRPAEAERSYNRARELYERLAARRPESDAYRDGLAKSCNNLGVLQADMGRPAEAERSYVRARDLYERLASERPEVDEYREGLARASNNLGNVQRTTGRPGEAEGSHLRAREQYERLVAERPESDAYREGLARACNNLGLVLARLGRPAEAERSYGRARELRERLVVERPDQPDFRSRLGGTLGNLAEHLAGTGRPEQARRTFREAIGHERAALAVEPRNPTFRRFLSIHLASSARLERESGRPAEAIAATAERRALWPGDPVQLYDVACEFSLCVPLAPDGSADRSRYGDLAIEVLREAVAAGWNDFRHTANDPDLIPLRDRADFRAMLAAMMDRAFPADLFAAANPGK